MINRLLTILLIGFFVVGGYVAYTAVTLPNVRQALETGVEPSSTSQVLARDKTLIMSYGKFQHKPIQLSDIPPTLIDALLATEDRRFYEHTGIDPIGIARALVQNVKNQGVHEGGSTLTQQLARNIFLSNERSIQRKVKEALLAIKLEQQLTKDQILELYLNNIYFGEGAYGIGAASEIYFGKPARSLNKAECALLAGLPQAPSRYSPFSNPDLARKRRNEVIDNLVETGKLSEGDANILKNRRFSLNPVGQSLSSSDKAPFFNRYVIQEALTMMDMDEQTFWQQGLKVYTTLDPRAQSIAERQVRNLSSAFGRTGSKQQAALLSLDPDGGMIAYVGGKNFTVSQFDRVSQAKRQAGSLFKVFVYTTAMEQGFSPLTVYKDEPLEFPDGWKPQNYDKGHRGYMSIAQALAQSNNIIAVKVLRDLSPPEVIRMARRMGLTSPMENNLSLALGAADVTLKEMTAAFSVLNNEGVYKEPYAIAKIVDRDGQVLYQHQPEERRVLQRIPRDTMVAMMQGVVKYGTGGAANFGRDVAGKTGTSDDYRDAWFIGYTPEATTGVWVGNDDNSKMPGVTGGSIPARIWRAYMSGLLSGLPRKNFDLAYALPVEEKDFFAYNLQHLSASEEPATEEELEAEEGTEETAEEPDVGANDETYSFIDGQMHPLPPQPIEVVVPPIHGPEDVVSPPSGVGQPPGNSGERPLPRPPGQERFVAPPGGGQPRVQRFVPGPATGNPSGARPIVDPINGQNAPRTPVQQPQSGASGF